MNILAEEIKHALQICVNTNEDVYRKFLERLRRGEFTRDENNTSHFCVYFLPYNKDTQEVFFCYHKKSGLWLSPGGHIDKGEGILEALNRN